MDKNGLLKLLHSMTLEEKINQMLQVSGFYFEYEEEGILTGPMNQAGITKRELDTAGSVIGIAGAEKLKKIQRAYMEKHPQGIPLLFMADVIYGFKTIFPIPLAQGCSFAPGLAREGAETAAAEAAAAGLHLTFSPMADLVRDPRWGRVMESTGEDAYLNSCFSAEMVKGYQGEEGLDKKGKIAACVKHFAGYGAPLGGRDYNTVELSKRTLMDQYMPAYASAINAGAATVMAAFNTLDGVPASANKWLMRDILRGELGFEGVLISDWNSILELIPHGLAETKGEAAKLAMEAGMDIDMMTTCYSRHLQKLVDRGEILEELVDEGVLRILELKNKLGLFEHPFKDADEAAEKVLVLSKAHREKARKMAEETLVLLKNENDTGTHAPILPISPSRKVAVMGPYADNPHTLGAWALFGEARDTVTLKAGIQNLLRNETMDSFPVFAAGCPILDDLDKVEMPEAEKEEILQQQKQRAALLAEAVDLARKSDVVVLALGEHYAQSGEAASRTVLNLSQGQQTLLDRIYEVNQEIILVLYNGRPLILPEIMKKCRAVLEVWMPGTEGGNAIANVLYGKVNPSGRLSMSFPYREGQIPVCYRQYSTGRPYQGEAYKYLSQYLDCPNEAFLPFGFGLSYTTFSYGPIRLNRRSMGKDGVIRAQISVKNTGTCEGKEVVQMYIQDKKGTVARPLRELKGFQKIDMKPGEEQEISFEITEPLLRFYGAREKWTSEPGMFRVYIGPDSTCTDFEEFELLSN